MIINSAIIYTKALITDLSSLTSDLRFPTSEMFLASFAPLRFFSLFTPRCPTQQKIGKLIDLHCHILPGVDDGPSHIEESLRMAECAVADGIHTLVATPHTYNETYHNPLPRILTHIAHLKKKLIENQIPIDICPGAEVRIHQNMGRSVKEGKSASINNTGHYILVEFPHNMILPGTREVLFHLILDGITPVLAHPERNLSLQRNPGVLSNLVTMGCLVQLTAMSITGELGQDTMEYAHYLLGNDRRT